MIDWLKQNSDKVLLLILTVFFTVVALHVMHDDHDAMEINWATGLLSSALGALLILITGNKYRQQGGPQGDKTDENKGGT